MPPPPPSLFSSDENSYPHDDSDSLDPTVAHAVDFPVDTICVSSVLFRLCWLCFLLVHRTRHIQFKVSPFKGLE
jgi:hypothetical protein